MPMVSYVSVVSSLWKRKEDDDTLLVHAGLLNFQELRQFARPAWLAQKMRGHRELARASRL